MPESQITFNEVPGAITELLQQQARIEQKFDQLLLKFFAPPDQNELLTVEQVCELFDVSKPTVYAKIAANEWPYLKRAKRVYFLRADLMDYMKAGRRKTTSELQAETVSFNQSK